MERNYFTIDAQMPSLNDYQAACRANKYRGASFKEETEQVVLWDLFEAKRTGSGCNVRRRSECGGKRVRSDQSIGASYGGIT